MASINLLIEKNDWEAFKSKVGHGHASSVIRQYIKSYIEPLNLNERKIRKQFDQASKEYEKAKAHYEKLKKGIEEIEQKNKKEEINQIEKQEKLSSKLKKLAHETAKKDLWRNI